MQSEEEVETYSNTNIVLIVYIITFLIGFPFYIMAFYTFIKKMRQKATPIDALLLNLTISDLIFLLVLPFKMKEARDNMKWNLPSFLCPLTRFAFHTTIYNSTLFLTAVSVDRYLAVAFPIKYKLKRRPLYPMVASGFFWLISMGHVSIVYFMQYFENFNTNTTQAGLARCYQNFTQEQMQVLMPVRLEVFVVLFYVPFFICCFCYMNFVRILSQMPNINPWMRLRAIGLSLGTLLVFAVCFAPFSLSHLMGFIQWECLSSTINACLDPIIFYLSSSAFSDTVHHLLRSMVQRVLWLWGSCTDLYSRTQDNPPSAQVPMTT
ncbi:hypothetical protein DPEC_G00350850 [Dallia pectoralis]|uniref:Uncharacterized protein n=1 Tax=Dallia pectoralis TaxID=75939 RepID=A0ACC2F269_DALPE|nr:hypothetical protein DPEC_G00350850 [Dallia pectoralis]